MRSLADILDVGPTPADPCEDDEDWLLLDALASAVTVLAERLRDEPGLPGAAAQLFCKQTAPGQSIHFRALIWPQARRQAGLPAHAKGGRPLGARASLL